MLELRMNEAKILRRQGKKISDIAQALGKSERTVYYYLSQETRARKKRRYPSKLDAYKYFISVRSYHRMLELVGLSMLMPVRSISYTLPPSTRFSTGCLPLSSSYTYGRLDDQPAPRWLYFSIVSLPSRLLSALRSQYMVYTLLRFRLHTLPKTKPYPARPGRLTSVTPMVRFPVCGFTSPAFSLNGRFIPASYLVSSWEKAATGRKRRRKMDIFI
jgi:hypothetical protein